MEQPESHALKSPKPAAPMQKLPSSAEQLFKADAEFFEQFNMLERYTRHAGKIAPLLEPPFKTPLPQLAQWREYWKTFAPTFLVNIEAAKKIMQRADRHLDTDDRQPDWHRSISLRRLLSAQCSEQNSCYARLHGQLRALANESYAPSFGLVATIAELEKKLAETHHADYNPKLLLITQNAHFILTFLDHQSTILIALDALHKLLGMRHTKAPSPKSTDPDIQEVLAFCKKRSLEYQRQLIREFRQEGEKYLKSPIKSRISQDELKSSTILINDHQQTMALLFELGTFITPTFSQAAHDLTASATAFAQRAAQSVKNPDDKKDSPVAIHPTSPDIPVCKLLLLPATIDQIKSLKSDYPHCGFWHLTKPLVNGDNASITTIYFFSKGKKINLGQAHKDKSKKSLQPTTAFRFLSGDEDPPVQVWQDIQRDIKTTLWHTKGGAYYFLNIKGEAAYQIDHIAAFVLSQPQQPQQPQIKPEVGERADDKKERVEGDNS